MLRARRRGRQGARGAVAIRVIEQLQVYLPLRGAGPCRSATWTTRCGSLLEAHRFTRAKAPGAAARRMRALAWPPAPLRRATDSFRDCADVLRALGDAKALHGWRKLAPTDCGTPHATPRRCSGHAAGATHGNLSAHIDHSTHAVNPTPYYTSHLAELHQRLLEHPVTAAHLNGTAIRLDGVELTAEDRFKLPSACELTALEFAHLFSMFNGSRVHQQAEKLHGPDDAPPGLYFTVVNTKLIRNQHKNKAGLVTLAMGTTDLFIDALHVDHFFLNKRATPDGLGTFAFTLSAITAHLAGLAHITLVAAGGVGFSPRHVGYTVWPRLGFDAVLLPGETQAAPQLVGCHTVQDVLAADPDWWEAHGSQRLMTFDLAAHSRSWQKLIPYAGEKARAEFPTV